MDNKEFKELEARVDQELIHADSYAHSIPESSIRQLREYFFKRKDLQINVQSSHITNPMDLNKKYIAIFSRVSTTRER